MPLVRCPQCGRVADGDGCLACGYEWSQKRPIAPSASASPASDDVLDELLALDGIDLQPAAPGGAFYDGAVESGGPETDVSLDDLDDWLGVGGAADEGVDEALEVSSAPLSPPAASAEPPPPFFAEQTPQAPWQPPYVDLGQTEETEVAREAAAATNPAPQPKETEDPAQAAGSFEPPTRRLPSLDDLQQAPFEVAAAGLGGTMDDTGAKTRVGVSVSIDDGQTLSARVIGLASSLDAEGRPEDAALLHEAARALLRHEL